MREIIHEAPGGPIASPPAARAGISFPPRRWPPSFWRAASAWCCSPMRAPAGWLRRYSRAPSGMCLGRGPGRARAEACAAGRAGFGARRGRGAGAAEALRPKAVVAFGGYPSRAAGAGRALCCRRRPRVVLHEQNAVLGRANRLLSRFADVLALNFAETQSVCRRREARWSAIRCARPSPPCMARATRPPAQTIELLVLGGSLGAKVFGTLVPQALARLPEALRARLHVTQQCRADDLEARARLSSRRRD